MIRIMAEADSESIDQRTTICERTTMASMRRSHTQICAGALRACAEAVTYIAEVSIQHWTILQMAMLGMH